MKLDIKLKSAQASASTEALQEASKRKASATETMEDAWVRILAQKNTDADLRKLREVKRAMDAGLIGREADKATKRFSKALGKFSKAEAIRLYAVLFEQQREEKLAELVTNTPSNYVLVADEQALRQIVADALKEPIIAVDTETTGLDVYVDVIVGVSLSLPTQDKHYYIPFEPTQDERALSSEMIEILRPLIESEDVKKVLHNAIYDIAMFRRHNINLNGLAWDSMTAMHLLNENEPSFRLKDLAPKYLGTESDTFDQLFGKNAKFAEVPLDIALVYAAKDTHLTWDLFVFQTKHMTQMPEMYEYYTSVEVPLLYVIVEMEANGFVLDLDFARQYGEQLGQEADELQRWLIDYLMPYHDGAEIINLNSGPQMKPALSKAIGKELPNLDAKRTLKPLKDKHEVVAKLLEYKRITKLSGTYIDSLPKKQHPVTKRWHSRFNPMGTVTGRFSSGKDEDSSVEQFNAANQPYEARKMFIAPPGKVIVGADFKAQEIRCVAYLSQEPALIEAFEKEMDPYAMLAVQYTGLPYEQVHKNPDGSDTDWRKKMKVAWLAWLYGASDFTLGQWLGTSKEEAGKFMGELKQSLPVLSAWLDGNTEFVKKYGFVWMDGDKRKRRLPEAKLTRKKIPYGKYYDPKYEEERKHNGKISGAIRMATNARVQGSSSIQMKTTMLQAQEECDKREGWRIYNTIYDELQFEIPDTFTREDIEVIRNIMLTAYRFGNVENGTDIEIYKRWGVGVSVDDWFSGKRD